jgi:hypothetical protein
MKNKQIVGYVPRLLFKIYLTLKEKFDPRPPVTPEEQCSIDICKELIPRQSSKLNYAPKSSKRFIKNDEFDMFIVINNSTIHLINHVYSYSVYIESSDLYSELLETFDLELERRREELELEITSNIQHSLKNILAKFN